MEMRCSCKRCIWCVCIKLGMRAAYRRIAQQQDYADRAAYCRCGGKKQCDYCWNQIFNAKHGAEEREYYAKYQTPLSATPLA